MGSSFLLMFPALNKFKFAKVFLNLLLLINKSASEQRNLQFQNTIASQGPIRILKACLPSAKNIVIVLLEDGRFGTVVPP